MNYKCLTGEALPISILSYFHRGFFWGITLSWIAGISVAMGAAITKSVYLDRQDYKLASQSDFTSEDSKDLDKQSIKQLNSDSSELANKSTTITVKKSKLSLPKFSFLQTKIASLINQDHSDNNISQSSKNKTPNKLISNQKEDQDKQLGQQQAPISNIIKETNNLETESNNYLFNDNESTQQLTYIVDSQPQQTNLEQFSSINAIKNFKRSKIIIRNSTSDRELTEYISTYLQERDFVNVEISSIEENIAQQEQTIIRADGQNFKSATYLKNILGFGDLELLPSGFLNTSDPSELIILLGSDAQVFSQNQNFVSFIK